jgi:hypothetical protein
MIRMKALALDACALLALGVFWSMGFMLAVRR